MKKFAWIPLLCATTALADSHTVPRDALVLPWGTKAPAWHQRPDERGSLWTSQLAAVGTEAAVVGYSTDHWLIVDRRRGVLGMLAAPAGTKWIGMTADDAIYTATADGHLWRAADPGAKLLALPQAPRASHWDAAGNLVVAALKDTVMTSTDGAQTFTSLPPPAAGVDIFQVLVRPDGEVIVESGNGTIWLWHDGQWTESAFHAWLERLGGWVFNRRGGDPDCEPGKSCFYPEPFVCPRAVLARDGVTWTTRDAGTPRSDARMQAWLSMTVLGEWSGAPYTRPASAAELEPPVAAGEALSGGERRCAPKPVPGIGTIGGGGGGAGCEGLACLAGTPDAPIAPTTTHYGLFADGHHAALVDGYRLTPIDLPAGCTPRQLVNLAGLGVLACADGAVRVVGADGIWHDEGQQLGASRELHASSAPDGTALLLDCTRHVDSRRTSSARDCHAGWVRAPVALGAASPWRAVAGEEHDLAYRVLSGGNVLVLADGGERGLRVSMDTAKGRKVLVDGVAASGVGGASIDHGHLLLQAGGRVLMVTAQGKAIEQTGP